MPYIDTMAGEKEFPSPLEVDRELYIKGFYGQSKSDRDAFPAPREVDREIYILTEENYYDDVYYMFPSPLEVDKELYRPTRRRRNANYGVSGPSRGR